MAYALPAPDSRNRSLPHRTMPNRAFILRMPLHLLAIALSHLDSTVSLGSAILAHSSLYASFREDRARVMRAILLNQIPPAILPYAHATFLAARLAQDPEPLTTKRVSHFLSRHVHAIFEFELSASRIERILFPESPEGDLSSAIDPLALHALSKTHTVVEHFTRHFARDTFPFAHRNLGLPQRGEENMLSADETFRIHRSIYRFQLYCNLFRHPYQPFQHLSLPTLIATFFFPDFSPWVNEQLACIHDYFERLLSRAFDEVAAHDIDWGHQGIPWLAVGDHNDRKQGYLLRGLDFLFKLDQAKTYAARRELLGDVPPRTQNMLGRTLWRDGSTNADYLEWMDFWQNIDTTSSNIRPDQVDYWVDLRWWSNPPDVYGSFAFRFWREAHKDCWREDVTFHVAHESLRRCGYLFWDEPEPRMSNQKLRALVLRGRLATQLERFRRKDLRPKARHSRKKRAEIYKQGGRGYWAEGDLSQVFWVEACVEGKTEPGEGKTEPRQPAPISKSGPLLTPLPSRLVSRP